mgnify:CR=1 FL=1
MWPITAFMSGLSSFGRHVGVGSSYGAFIAPLGHIAQRLVAGDARQNFFAEYLKLLRLLGRYLLKTGGRVAVDQVARGLVLGAFVIAVIPLLSLLWTVIVNGASTLFTANFLTQTMNGVTGLPDEATQLSARRRRRAAPSR